MPQTPGGRPVFRPGQRLTSKSLNAIIAQIDRMVRGLNAIGDDSGWIVSAPDAPLGELVVDASSGYALRLSAFTVVVMGEPVDLATLPEAERSLPLPAVPVAGETVRLFLEIRHRRVVVAPGSEAATGDWDVESLSTIPDAYLLDVPVPALATSTTASKGSLEIARVRRQGEALTLVPDFMPMAMTLGSVPEMLRRIAAHLSPVIDVSDRAARALLECEDLHPATRGKLAAFAAVAREIRSILADHGRRPCDACRVIATALAEPLHGTEVTRSEERHPWLEHHWAEARLLPVALPIEGFCRAGDKLLATLSREGPEWVVLSTQELRVSGTTASTVFSGDLDAPLEQLVGHDCQRLLVELRARARFATPGPVLFHPSRSRDRAFSCFGEIVPRSHEDGLGFAFEVPFDAGSDQAGEILSNTQIRIVCPIERAEAPAGTVKTGIDFFPGLTIQMRKVS